MPLQMPPELLFPTGPTIPLPDAAVQDFLGCIRKIHSASGRKHVFELFKRAFCLASGEPYYTSSSEGWAETDLIAAADKAAENAPGFIQAFVDTCETLQSGDAVFPDHTLINYLLDKHSAPFRIENGKLVVSSNFVAPPEALQDAASVAAKAFAEAAGLVRKGQAPSAIDRIHTALHAYLLETCGHAGVAVGNDPTTAKLFKLLREGHPAFLPMGPRHEDVTRVLRSFASAIDALSPIRNNASLAHANPLLDEPEAIAVVNAAYTIFRYVQDSLGRHHAGTI